MSPSVQFDWWSPSSRVAPAVHVVLVVFLMIGTGGVVYIKGGTFDVWEHLMYLPVILAGAAFGIHGGVAAAIGGGLILGPYMPVYLPTGAMQSTETWLIRTGFFLAVGILAGCLFSMRRHQLEKLTESYQQLTLVHEELQSTQLQLIQKAKLESVGRLAAGIAHEIKNPLAIIQLGVDFLASNAKGDDVLTPVAAEMADAVSRADQIVKGLLDFSRSEQLTRRHESINHLLEESLHLVAHALAASGIKLETRLAADLPLLLLDGNKIKQVFINIFLNAVQAMSGSRRLMIVSSAMRQLTPEELLSFQVLDMRPDPRVAVVCVTVDDSGSGIAKAHQAKLFDPFFTTKAPGEGTGLGLSVSSKIVKLHQGILTLANRQEGGVCATVLFIPPEEAYEDHDDDEKNPAG